MQLPLLALALTSGTVWVATRGTLDASSIAPGALIAAGLLCSRRCAYLAIPFTVGVLWAWLRAWALLQPELPAAVPGSDLVVVGDIASLPEMQPGRVQFDFELHEAYARGLPARLRLSWYNPGRVPQAAETWRLVVRLRAPRGFANPGGHDYEGELFRAGIGATGYVRDSVHNRWIAARVGAYPVLALRAAIAQRIERVLGDSPATGVIAGLAVGASQGISAEQWRVFGATGTTHLIAISGLHVTMVAALAMLIAQALWRLPRKPPRRTRPDVACLCGALAAFAYAALAGFSVPTQRTLVMLLCALSATWLRRAQPPVNVLSVALIAVLLYDPHSVLTAGLWLSFVAVAAIIVGIGGVPERPGLLRAFLATQAVVSVALVPATALLFGSVSLVAPLANLFAIPLFSVLLVPGTLLAIALIPPFAWLGELLLHFTARLLEVSWPAFAWAASLPGALIHVPAPGPWQALLLVVTAVVLMSPLPGRLRAPGILLFIALLGSNPGRPAAGAFTLAMLDVGQGASVVVRTHSHALLFDTGPAFRSGRSAGDLVIGPYLHAEGIRQVDMLVTSHADNDHAGGASAILQAFTVLTVREGGNHQIQGAPASACRSGEAWIWDGVRFEFLHPQNGEHWSDNNGSCVLSISTGARRALLTGDIERDAEAHLVARGALSHADVVAMPHHGSRSSSSDTFVARLHAHLALVSAGAANRWGFPHASSVRRWCEAGTQVIGTAEWGAITIAVDASTGVTRPRAYRREHRRYWHARSPEAGYSRCPGREDLVEGAVYASGTVKYHPPRFVTRYH